MTAAGKITASEIGKRPLGSVRILITDDRGGRAAIDPAGDGPWYPAYNKRGMVVATVTNVGFARGNRRSRVDLTTDRGEVNDLSPSQTFWLAPEAPAQATSAAASAPTPKPDTVAKGRCVKCGHVNAITGAAQQVTCAGEGCSAPVWCGDVEPTHPGGFPSVTITATPDRITVKQLIDTQGVRVLLVDRHNQYAGGGAGEWTAARTAPPRGELYVKGERAEVHAATVIEVKRVAGTYGSRYDVVTNLGTVERVTAAQAFRLAPASMHDTADVRAELAADREQREARAAADLAAQREQAADRDAQAERDRAAARQWLADRAPEPASTAPSDRVRIERHRASVTQGEVSVWLDGERLARYGDKVEICKSGHGREPGTHEDGAVCFGGYHGLGDAHWYEVANRVAARRALAEPVYTDNAGAGVDFHALTDAGMTRTPCGWSTSMGQIRERAAVVAAGGQPCTTCYPVPATTAAPMHPIEGRGCANAEAAAQLVAGRPSRTLTARRVPEVGCAVYDARTGEKVYPAGERWLPNLPAARVKCAELLAADIAERLEEGRRQIAEELAAYEAATAAAPAGFGGPVVSGPHAPTGSVRVCDVGGEQLDGPWFLVSAGAANEWTADRGASCPTHCGQPVPAAGVTLTPGPLTGAPTGYAAAVEAAAEPAPAVPASIQPAEMFRHFKVLHKPTGRVFWVEGGDTRYETTGPGVWDYRAAPTGDGVLLRSAVHTHPWGWVAPLTDLAPAPDGSGMYHPDHIAGVMQLQLEMSYEGSWRQYAAAAAEPFVSAWSTYATAGK